MVDRQQVSASLVAVLLVVGLIGAGLAYNQVPEGHEGVVKEFGAVTGDTRDSGAHLVIPVVEQIQNVEIRPRTYTMSNTQGEGQRNEADAITVKTVNGSSVNIDVTVRYRIDSNAADTFVEDWNDEPQLERRLIRPTIRSVLRDEASSLQTTGDGAIYKTESRQRLGRITAEALSNSFEQEPVILEAVQIRNVDLPDSIDQALDEKEEAKQRVQVEQERVKQERARAEQKRVQAQAEADVIEIEGQALRENPIVLQQQYISALQGGSVFVVGSGGNGSGSTPIILDPQMTGGSDNTTTTNTSVVTGNDTQSVGETPRVGASGVSQTPLQTVGTPTGGVTSAFDPAAPTHQF
jgi:regulator of protease activity HflC (stomatin/prohibitin superfamily)